MPKTDSECRRPAGASSTGDRLPLLDYLRGVAVLAVMALHTGSQGLQMGDGFFVNVVWPVLQHGYLGVQLFFVISGYCIMAAAVAAQSNRTPLKTFVRRRIQRIYPPFWCSLVFVAGLGLLTAVMTRKSWQSVFPLDAADWLWNVLLLQGAFHAPDVSMVYWSLSIEVQFYALMAVTVIAGRRIAVWLLGLSTFYLCWVWQPLLPISGTALAYWPEFASGIAAYLAVNSRVWGKSLPAAVWGLTAAAIVMGWISNPAVFAPDGEFATAYKQLFCLFCGIGIWLAHSRVETGRLLAPLRPLAWIGTISYSLYLTHEPVVTRVFNFVGRIFNLDDYRWLPVAVLALFVQFLVGCLFFRYCERPWLNRSSSAAAPTVETADLPVPAVPEAVVG